MIKYSEKFDEYGIPDYIAHNHKNAPIQLIRFCPWCGIQLPDSKRDEWYDKLEEMGINPNFDKVPIEYTTDQWWKCR